MSGDTPTGSPQAIPPDTSKKSRITSGRDASPISRRFGWLLLGMIVFQISAFFYADARKTDFPTGPSPSEEAILERIRELSRQLGEQTKQLEAQSRQLDESRKALSQRIAFVEGTVMVRCIPDILSDTRRCNLPNQLCESLSTELTEINATASAMLISHKENLRRILIALEPLSKINDNTTDIKYRVDLINNKIRALGKY